MFNHNYLVYITSNKNLAVKQQLSLPGALRIKQWRGPITIDNKVLKETTDALKAINHDSSTVPEVI